LEIEPNALITKDLENEDIWSEAGDEPLARSRGKWARRTSSNGIRW